MASCCPPGSAPYLAADHKDEGTVRSVDDVPFYQVGSGERGLLLLPDIWGWNGGRTRALADEFAKKGLSVWVPKLLTPVEGGTDGDALPPTFDIGKRGGELGALFGGDWHSSKTTPKVLKVIGSMKNVGIKKMGILGVCYGAWIANCVANDPPKGIDLVGCASAHPSIHLEGGFGDGDPAALAARSTVPFALFPCGEVGSNGADPDIYDSPDGALYKALEKKHAGKNVTKRFTAMRHGFFTRGSYSGIPDALNAGTGDAVKAAVEECFRDILEFLVRRGLTSRSRAGLPQPPPKLRVPKFGKVQSIRPDAKGLNLKLKAVKCEDVTAPGDKAPQTWEAKLGDDTGVVTFSLRNKEQADLCKAGACVRVQNARVLMLKGHIRVIVDKWAVLKPLEEPLDFEPNTAKDVSGQEYELA
eukprot:TRINITY_DN62873_c0_g1_i1.p2 TRINITY_DN62873_c0_g1~~TRINITY_DN62873_c0_g1_i1.p2  ORF type:complete len:415 (-),score=101.29 TRINITY_DN62873_c0_g1_i1:145-1389(-)